MIENIHVTATPSRLLRELQLIDTFIHASDTQEHLKASTSQISAPSLVLRFSLNDSVPF